MIERFEIKQKANHIHSICDSYNNLNGIDVFWHNDLLEYVKKDITAPKRIHSDLTDQYGKRIRVNDDGEIVILKWKSETLSSFLIVNKYVI